MQGTNSIYSKVNSVSKMNFPVSVLPTIKIVGNSISLIPILLLNSNSINIWYFLWSLLIPDFYYLIYLYFFLFAITLLLSTLTTIIRDIQMIVQSVVRLLIYFANFMGCT